MAEKKKNTKEELKEMTDTAKRLQAEFENYRKRSESEKQKNIDRVKAELFREFISVIDLFELALRQKEDTPFYHGMEMVFAQFKQVLEKEGVDEIGKEEKFNPAVHEAILTEPSEKKDDTILEVIQKGYKYNDILIRHAKVKVAKSEVNQNE